jgi:hypothetical protein
VPWPRSIKGLARVYRTHRAGTPPAQPKEMTTQIEQRNIHRGFQAFLPQKAHGYCVIYLILFAARPVSSGGI